MGKTHFRFNPRHWLVGITWDKPDPESVRCEFFELYLGPFHWFWNISKPKIEWIGPFTDGPLSDVLPPSSIRKSTD